MSQETTTFQATLHFATRTTEGGKTRQVLLADEAELAEARDAFQRQHASLARQLERIKERADVDPGVQKDQVEAVEELMQRAEEQFHDYLARHELEMMGATKVVYTLEPYSYFDRIMVQDAKSKRDLETGQVFTNEELVKEELLSSHVNARDGVPLNQAQVRRELKGPVASRLWRLLREESEPSEADLFRAGSGAG